MTMPVSGCNGDGKPWYDSAAGVDKCANDAPADSLCDGENSPNVIMTASNPIQPAGYYSASPVAGQTRNSESAIEPP